MLTSSHTCWEVPTTQPQLCTFIRTHTHPCAHLCVPKRDYPEMYTFLMAESLGLPTYQIGSGSWIPPLILFPLPVPFPSVCLSFSISQSQGNPLGPFIRCEMLIHLSATCPSREQERVIPPWVLSCPFSHTHPSKTPLPSSAGPLITHPDPHSPIPHPLICLPRLSICLSVHLSIHPSFLPCWAPSLSALPMSHPSTY